MILLVEDNPITRKTVAEILRADGYRVRTAANYVEARDELARRCPEILVLDQVLPCGRTGTELLHEPSVKECWAIMKVIIISALDPTDSQLTELGKLPPNTVMVQKPFKVRELVEEIEKSLQLGAP